MSNYLLLLTWKKIKSCIMCFISLFNNTYSSMLSLKKSCIKKLVLTESRIGTVYKLAVTISIFLKGLRKLNNNDKQHSNLPLLVMLCHTEVSDSQQLISPQSATFIYHDTLTLPLEDSEESGTSSKNLKEWRWCKREVIRVWGLCQCFIISIET